MFSRHRLQVEVAGVLSDILHLSWYFSDELALAFTICSRIVDPLPMNKLQIFTVHFHFYIATTASTGGNFLELYLCPIVKEAANYCWKNCIG